MLHELLHRPLATSPLASRSDFGRGLRHVIRVPAGPDGRPGERLLAPSRTLHPAHPPSTLDGSRTDFRVLLTRTGSTFGAVCLGRVADRGTPEAAARRERGPGACDEPLASDVLFGVEVPRRDTHSPRTVLHDWYFEHDGWLFVAGVLRPRYEREDVALERARAVLATWRWVDASDGDADAEPDGGREPVPSWPSGKLPRPTGAFHAHRVPPVPGAASGYRLRSVGGSSCPPTCGPDGSRSDLMMRVEHRAVLTTGVIGRTGRLGTPQTHLRRHLALTEQRGDLRGSAITPCLLAGEPALHLRMLGADHASHLWCLAHRGWLHVAELHLHGADERRALATTQAMLATWRWLDPAWAEPEFTEPAWRPD